MHESAIVMIPRRASPDLAGSPRAEWWDATPATSHPTRRQISPRRLTGTGNLETEVEGHLDDAIFRDEGVAKHKAEGEVTGRHLVDDETDGTISRSNAIISAW